MYPCKKEKRQKKRTKVVYSGKNTQRLYSVSSITKVPGVVQTVFSIYGFIIGTVIYTHVCILVCI